MPTPSIQTLRTDAQQVLNLDSISAVRSVVAATLANANAGTPLNPNLTTQQLWNEFYQIVTQPKSDIESIIANQLMKFLYAPPAPGGVGANGQVIFNDGGVLAGDPQFLWNKTTNLLTVTGSATITGDLTVRTNRLIVNSNGAGIGTTPSAWGAGTRGFELANGSVVSFAGYIGTVGTANSYYNGSNWIYTTTAAAARYDQDNGSHIWFNAPSGTAGNTVGWSTAMTLNSTGLGVGIPPSYKLNIGAQNPTGGNIAQFYNNATSSLNGAFAIITQYGVQDWFMGQPAGVSAFTIGTGTTSKSEFFRIDASGNLLVGTTTANARLDVRTSASQRIINAISTAAGDASTYGVYIGKFSNDSTTAQRFIGFTINNDGAGSGQINANGASQAAFGSFSDYRLKENIVSLPSQLANILSLRPVEFDYKDGSGHQIGFVAQEIQEVYADTVAEQDGFLTVTGWSKTEARLVSAIKELAAKVQALEAKLA